MSSVESIKDITDQSESLLDRVDRLEQEVDSLKEKSTVDEVDKARIESPKDIIKEVRAFISRHGYSKTLKTSSCFKKLLYVLFTIPLVAACLYFMTETFRDFSKFDVITDIQPKEEETMTFPAVTFCLVSFDYVTGQRTARSLRDAIIECSFKGKTEPCSFKDFFNFQLISDESTTYDCYQFNSLNSPNPGLYETSLVGAGSGLTLTLNLSDTEFVYYYVGDNGVRPVFKEMINIAQMGKYLWIDFRKLVEIKLPDPFSSCTLDISPGTSDLVKYVLDQNITYRKVNCFDRCKEDRLDSCLHLCPLECEKKIFDMNVNFFSLPDSQRNTLIMNVYYLSTEFTESVQTAKVSVSDLVASVGGIVGIFIELSILSIYRLIISFIDLL